MFFLAAVEIKKCATKQTNHEIKTRTQKRKEMLQIKKQHPVRNSCPSSVLHKIADLPVET